MNTKALLLIALMLVGAVAIAYGQPASPAAQHGLTATRQTVINVSELARREALWRSPVGAGKPAPPAFMPASNGGVNPPPSPAPASSFQATEKDVANPDLVPPDTHGAVGPNHLMATFNNRVQVPTGVHIQDRLGNVISAVSLSNFWGLLGPFSTNLGIAVVTSLFDPRVLYDPYADRFIILVLADNDRPPTSSLYLGVSQTGDPTGNWNLYAFDADSSNQAIIDFPFIGFNKDWIVVQALMVLPGDFLRNVEVFVFNKTNLFTGGAGLHTRFNTTTNRLTPAVTFDASLSTLFLLSPDGRGVAPGGGGARNTVLLWSITGPVGGELLSQLGTITTTNTWDYNAPAGYNVMFAPQLGTTNKLQTKWAFIESLVYRNGSLWASQTVFLPAGGAANRTSVQWWQLSPQGAILQRSLIDDPTAQNFYAYSSLSVNRYNDVLVGYSSFSSDRYAGAGYSFRAGNDPPNLMRADRLLKDGEAIYYRPYNGRTFWGDYSATTVDPVNDVDLWTIQSYAALPGENGSRWGAWWGGIVPPALNLGFTSATSTEGDSGSTNVLLNVTLSRTNDQTITVDFATADGTAVVGQDYAQTNGTLVFQPGETDKIISVLVNGDRLDEGVETFFVNFSNPSNVVLAFTQAAGTILDDDPAPALSINDISVKEGDTGLVNTTFTLSLSVPSGLPVSVRAQTANITATLRVDYVPTNVIVIIPVGATNQTTTIQVIGDTVIESNETFRLSLLSPTNATLADSQGICTIVDDDFRLTGAQIVGNDVRLSFATQTNRNYRVERTDGLAPPIVWEPVGGATNVSGTGDIVEVIDSEAASQSQRFYRVVLP